MFPFFLLSLFLSYLRIISIFPSPSLYRGLVRRVCRLPATDPSSARQVSRDHVASSIPHGPRWPPEGVSGAGGTGGSGRDGRRRDGGRRH